MTAKVSSIHVNGWFGSYDKLGMTRTLLSDVFGVDLDAQREHYVFAGDSPNDAPMFAYFPNAVGVANVRAVPRSHRHAAAIRHHARGGRGLRGARGLPARLRASRSRGTAGHAAGQQQADPRHRGKLARR